MPPSAFHGGTGYEWIVVWVTSISLSFLVLMLTRRLVKYDQVLSQEGGDKDSRSELVKDFLRQFIRLTAESEASEIIRDLMLLSEAGIDGEIGEEEVVNKIMGTKEDLLRAIGVINRLEEEQRRARKVMFWSNFLLLVSVSLFMEALIFSTLLPIYRLSLVNHDIYMLIIRTISISLMFLVPSLIIATFKVRYPSARKKVGILSLRRSRP